MLARYAPAPEIADLVERHWIVRWSLPPGSAFTQVVIPHPCVNLVAEPGGLTAYGIPPGLFERQLHGSGVVVGTKFRPGAFAQVSSDPAMLLPGAAVPADRLFGPAAEDSGRRALALAQAGDDVAAVAEAGRFVRGVQAAPGQRDRERVTTVFAHLVSGRLGPGATVADLAEAAGVAPRSLQRIFARAVGVSPKWVLQRHRVHLAAELLGADPTFDLASLASAVGYYDQSHFTTDFAQVVGQTPGTYARRCAQSKAAACGHAARL